MAKDKKAKKADTKGKASKSKDDDEDKAPEFKYGVPDIAEELGIKEASVRVQLRNKGIEKAGKSYGWNSKSELKEVIDQLKTSTKSDDDDEDTPKKAKKDKKGKAKKASSKKSKKDEEDEDDDD